VSHTAKILTVSDSVANDEAEDLSGSALASRLERAGFTVVERRVVEDGVEPVSAAIKGLTEDFSGLVVTTGGTGFAPRDQTPEATLAVLDRVAPGLAEAMRAADPAGRLSRAVAGTRRRALVLNTPGSPAGAVQFLEAVIDVLPHALDVLAGDPGHGHHVADAHTSVVDSTP
jgi:molybdopterin adenylyltransferase